MYTNPYLYNPVPMPRQNNGITWVQGESGAKSFIVGSGQTVLLMDSEADKFYIKSADMSGMPSMRVFTYTEELPRNASNPSFNIEEGNFITKAQLDEELTKIKEMIKGEEDSILLGCYFF